MNTPTRHIVALAVAMLASVPAHAMLVLQSPQKRSINSSNVSSASDLRVVFNATEPGNDGAQGITLNDLALSIYSPTGELGHLLRARCDAGGSRTGRGFLQRLRWQSGRPVGEPRRLDRRPRRLLRCQLRRRRDGADPRA